MFIYVICYVYGFFGFFLQELAATNPKKMSTSFWSTALGPNSKIPSASVQFSHLRCSNQSKVI